MHLHARSFNKNSMLSDQVTCTTFISDRHSDTNINNVQRFMKLYLDLHH